MLKIKWVVIYTALIIFCLVSLPVDAAQPSTVSSDIIFSTGTQTGANNIIRTNVLAYFNSKTLTASKFYEDESAIFVKGLSWSPNGDLLAILAVQSTYPYSAKICLLQKNGKLIRCFDGLQPHYAQNLDDLLVTWSVDSSKIYFVTDTPNEMDLVEVNVSLGTKLRILYHYTLSDNETEAPVISWTSDLKYIITGAGSYKRRFFSLPITLTNQEDGTQIDLLQVGPEQGRSNRVICSSFSPKNDFITSSDFIEGDPTLKPQFFIYSVNGTVLQSITMESGAAVPSGCVAWAKDESAFYFDAHQLVDNKAYLVFYKYTLSNKALTEVFRSQPYSSPEQADIFGKLVLSPKMDNIAYTSNLNPNPNAGSSSIVTIVSVDGRSLQIGDPYLFSDQPLWVVDQTTDEGSPTYGATSIISQTVIMAPSTTPNSKLNLTSLCSSAPTANQLWRVRNPSPSDVSFTWDIYGSSQKGYGSAKANGDTYFQTNTVPSDPNTARIFVNGALQSTKASGGAQCVATPTPPAGATATPIPQKLKLTSMCSPDPATVRSWRIRNANTGDVAFTYDVYGTQQKGSGVVPAGADLFFSTTTVPNSPNTTRLFVGGVQQDVKASSTNSCTPIGAPTNTPTAGAATSTGVPSVTSTAAS